MGEGAIDSGAFQAFEKAGWEERAGTYGDFVGLITSRLVEPLLDAANVASGTRVLDVATGPGYAAAAAADRGAEVVAVDVAQEMVALARRLHPGLDVREGSAEQLPFAEESFDAVVGNFLVPHLAQPEAAASELARVIRPSGRLALTTWDVPARSGFPGIFLDASTEAGAQAPPDLPAGPPLFRFAEESEFAALLRGAGLDDVDVETVEFTHRVQSSDELWDGLLSGSVRVKPLLVGQAPELAARIRLAFDARLQRLRREGAFALPVGVKLASGRRP